MSYHEWARLFLQIGPCRNVEKAHGIVLRKFRLILPKLQLGAGVVQMFGKPFQRFTCLRGSRQMCGDRNR